MVFGTNPHRPVDAPAGMNGQRQDLCCLGPSAPTTGRAAFTNMTTPSTHSRRWNAPGGSSTYGNSAPFGTSMLDLPDGTVLFVVAKLNLSCMFIRRLARHWLRTPAINSITENADGSYQNDRQPDLQAFQRSGYGDDERCTAITVVRMSKQRDRECILRRRTFQSGTARACRTGSRVITHSILLAAKLPAGSYFPVVVANGNPSASQTFSYAPPAVPNGVDGCQRQQCLT